MRSVLELRRGGTPFPHGDPDGTWRHRHAVRPAGPTALDTQAVQDFLDYERRHGRAVEVVADADLGDWRRWPPATTRLAPMAFPTQCCTPGYADGCASPLLVHGTTPDRSDAILTVGAILPSTLLRERSAADLAGESTWGEPPDYFEHVMLANGRCTAPDAVALSRSLRRDLVPSDLEPRHEPAVRFYFRWTDIVAMSTVAFDGVHPAKVRGALTLDDHLVAIVAHRDRAPSPSALPPAMRDRLMLLSSPPSGPHEWATRCDRAARRRV